MYVSYTLDIFCLCILKHRSQKYLGIDEKCFQLLICNICKIETVLKTAEHCKGGMSDTSYANTHIGSHP